MNSLVIVSPHFPPSNAPDHQRVRLALPFLRKQGWNPHVIAVAAEDVSAPIDHFLTKTFPEDIPIERTRVPSGIWTRIPGLGNLGYRSKPALKKALESVLREVSRKSESDKTLVYFSTTQFPVHGLIPFIKHYPEVKIVMDFQDRWVNHYYADNPNITPPGGHFKYGVDRWLAMRTERRILPLLDGFTQVSSRYGEELDSRFPALKETPRLTLPFGAAETDFDAVNKSGVKQTHFDPQDGKKHWVYVGRCGPDMEKSLRGFFRALRNRLFSEPALADTLRIHFLGTNYAAGERAKDLVAPLAHDEGVGQLIREKPHRIPYAETLRCLLDADALIVPGSDDAAYNASKIFPYILARRPLLAVFHEESPVCHAIKDINAGCLVSFNASTAVEEIARSIEKRWFGELEHQRLRKANWGQFTPHSAAEMTRQLARFFDTL